MRKVKNNEVHHTDSLRSKAERILELKSAGKGSSLSETEALTLIYELAVHEIELERQNEELKSAKLQMQAAAKKYSEFYQLAPVSFFSLSRAGEMIDLNNLTAQTLGKERQKLKNSPFGFFVEDGSKAVFNDFLNRVFARNGRESCELTLLTPNNRPKFVQLMGIHASRGEECLVSLLDITEQNLALKKMQESEHKLRTALYYTYDWEYWQNEDRKIIYMSPSCERITGYNAEEFISDPDLVKRVVHPDDLDRYNAHLTTAFSTAERDKVFEYDYRVLHKNGTITFIDHVCRPVYDDDNRYAGRRVSNRDVTERRNAENEISLKNDELQIVNAEKDKFFSIIAHDLRSPFNVLLGFTQLLADELPTIPQDQVQKIVESMRTSANSLFILLENLLEWSRMRRRVIKFKPELLNLAEKTAACQELFQFTAEKKRIGMTTDIPENLMIKADARMLESLLRNLLSNAIKFTPAGGKVSLTAKPGAGQSVEISVKDTGIGMSSSTIGKLFHLDEMIKQPGTEGEPSSGLGLLICKEYVEMHGGRIWVESEPGLGSTFTCTFPG